MKMTVFLDEDEGNALKAIAERELRFPRDQVRFILRSELERRGLLAALGVKKTIGESHEETGADEVSDEQ